MEGAGQAMHQTHGNSLVRNDWPTRFDADTVMSEGMFSVGSSLQDMVRQLM